jgi:transposase
MMFPTNAATKIFLATGATDLRKSFDTLSGVVRSWQSASHGGDTNVTEDVDPLSGHLFVFCNRRRDRIKVLFFDGTGLWICAKRLERGSFNWPGDSEQTGKVTLDQQELGLLLSGVDLSNTRQRRWWRNA